MCLELNSQSQKTQASYHEEDKTAISESTINYTTVQWNRMGNASTTATSATEPHTLVVCDC